MLPEEVAIGEVIGSYRLERLLGAGSTAHVFLGQHVRLGRKAAIKVLAVQLLNHKETIARLLQEARVVNDIRHPNIIDIVDFVETEAPPRFALVMEYIEGPTLKALGDYKLSYEQSLGIAVQLVAAIQAAHAADVIHRDIKPDNVLLIRDPRNEPATKIPRIKIVDFGIAKLAGQTGKTIAGTMIGTPAYMAPEQIAGKPPASPATDVFAIGALIFELLSGKRAYPSQTIHEIVRQKLRGEVPELVLPQMPAQRTLLELILRCLAHRPQDRPNLAEVRQTLLQLVPWEQARADVAHVMEPGTRPWMESLDDPTDLEVERESLGASRPRSEPARPEPARPEPARAEPARPEPSRSRPKIPVGATAASDAAIDASDSVPAMRSAFSTDSIADSAIIDPFSDGPTMGMQAVDRRPRAPQSKNRISDAATVAMDFSREQSRALLSPAGAQQSDRPLPETVALPLESLRANEDDEVPTRPRVAALPDAAFRTHEVPLSDVSPLSPADELAARTALLQPVSPLAEPPASPKTQVVNPPAPVVEKSKSAAWFWMLLLLFVALVLALLFRNR